MKILIPFHHDGTLIFASRFGRKLEQRGHDVSYLFISGAYALQDRQLEMYLAGHPYLQCDGSQLSQKDFISGQFSGFDAVMMCTPARAIKRMLESRSFKRNTHRPCFVCFHPGLELFFEYGLSIRQEFDVLFLTPEHRVESLRKRGKAPFSPYWQHLGYGHPYFVEQSNSQRDLAGAQSNVSDRRDIYFLAQSVSPETWASRYHIVEVLLYLAHAWRDRTFHIKLRYVLGEQKSTPHEEQFSYIELLSEACAARGIASPKNLLVTDCHIDEVMDKAAGVIACTSTALMDAVSAGVPALAYVDYVDFWNDPLNLPFRQLFEGSGLLASLSDVLELRFEEVNPAWKAQFFRAEEEIFLELEEACLKFQG